MCDCDCEYPEFFIDKWVKARKSHKCGECRRPKRLAPHTIAQLGNGTERLVVLFNVSVAAILGSHCKEALNVVSRLVQYVNISGITPTTRSDIDDGYGRIHRGCWNRLVHELLKTRKVKG